MHRPRPFRSSRFSFLHSAALPLPSPTQFPVHGPHTLFGKTIKTASEHISGTDSLFWHCLLTDCFHRSLSPLLKLLRKHPSPLSRHNGLSKASPAPEATCRPTASLQRRQRLRRPVPPAYSQATYAWHALWTAGALGFNGIAWFHNDKNNGTVWQSGHTKRRSWRRTGSVQPAGHSALHPRPRPPFPGSCQWIQSSAGPSNGLDRRQTQQGGRGQERHDLLSHRRKRHLLLPQAVFACLHVLVRTCSR